MLHIKDGKIEQNALNVEIKVEANAIQVFADGKLVSHSGNCVIEVTGEQGCIFVNGVRYEKVTVVYEGTYCAAYEHNYGVAYILSKLPATISESI